MIIPSLEKLVTAAKLYGFLEAVRNAGATFSVEPHASSICENIRAEIDDMMFGAEYPCPFQCLATLIERKEVEKSQVLAALPDLAKPMLIREIALRKMGLRV